VTVGWLKCQVLQQFFFITHVTSVLVLIIVQESEDPEDEDAPVITTMRWKGGEIKSVT